MSNDLKMLTKIILVLSLFFTACTKIRVDKYTGKKLTNDPVSSDTNQASLSFYAMGNQIPQKVNLFNFNPIKMKGNNQFLYVLSNMKILKLNISSGEVLDHLNLNDNYAGNTPYLNVNNADDLFVKLNTSDLYKYGLTPIL